MSWAQKAIESLQKGETCIIYPKGNSMRGKVKSGAKVTLAPRSSYHKNDIVLVKVKGRIYLHLIKAIKDDRYLIGNNVGGVNGWVGINSIYGLAIKVEN